jgi:hypothetical protein
MTCRCRRAADLAGAASALRPTAAEAGAAAFPPPRPSRSAAGRSIGFWKPADLPRRWTARQRFELVDASSDPTINSNDDAQIQDYKERSDDNRNRAGPIQSRAARPNDDRKNR